MANSGRTVLVFLGTCLAFAEAGVGVIAALASPNGNLVAGFALLALGMVLLTLAYMYQVNPGFLTLSGEQASVLATLPTEMSFVKQLRWRKNFENFSPDQQKLMLAVSDTRYLWRSLDRLEGVTRLDPKTFTEALNDLMAQGWIRASVSQVRKEPVFELVERVGEGGQLQRVKS